jgi:hypothetical protein
MMGSPSSKAFNSFLEKASFGYEFHMENNNYEMTFPEYCHLFLNWCQSNDLESIGDAIDQHAERIT